MRILIATAILSVSTVTAFAQATTPAARPATAPTAPVAAAPATPVAVPVGIRPAGSVARNVAATQADARSQFQAKLTARQQTCGAKGALYEFVPPHAVGDANPAGGFYTSNNNGGCRLISMKTAIAKGLLKQ